MKTCSFPSRETVRALMTGGGANAGQTNAMVKASGHSRTMRAVEQMPAGKPARCAPPEIKDIRKERDALAAQCDYPMMTRKSATPRKHTY